MKQIFICVLWFTAVTAVTAQNSDSSERFSLHAQTTVIYQTKAPFSAKYSGEHSLKPEKEDATSLTSTLFFGTRLWKGACFFINPEIAGGSGLSQALGIAAAPNGETFRIGSAAPKIYMARMFFRQVFSLGANHVLQASDFNQMRGYIPEHYFAITIGKVGIADYFDDNAYSHDARTQFMSWALMSNGAWDYPANTRGYTPSAVLEYVSKKHELRYGFSLVPLTANGNDMNWQISEAGSNTLEYSYHYATGKRPGTIRLLTFYTVANMGNYRQSIALSPDKPKIEDTRKNGSTKYGFAVNADQQLVAGLGCFFRASWNDGLNETWAFTEIDRAISAGLSLTGEQWKRKADVVGLAYAVSGISPAHRDYLKAGGKGFMLGDGHLNYRLEHFTELYYSAQIVSEKIFISAAYQLLVNPGYNLDRHGPVHIASLRVHIRV